MESGALLKEPMMGIAVTMCHNTHSDYRSDPYTGHIHIPTDPKKYLFVVVQSVNFQTGL